WRKRYVGADYNIVPYRPSTDAESKVLNAVTQLRVVMTADFSAQDDTHRVMPPRRNASVPKLTRYERAGPSALSIAARTLASVGVVRVPNAAIKCPSRPIRILWKFHCGTAAWPRPASAH